METLVFKQASEKKNSLKSYGTVTNVIGVNGKVVPTNPTRALEEQACALNVIETQADKTALNPDTNLYEKVLDEDGNVVKETILTLGYAGTDTSALTIDITAEDLAKAESAKRSVNWENLIAL
jgi:hypothetical protein